MKRYEIEGCPLTRGRTLWLVMEVVSEDLRQCVFSSRDENAAHARAESLAISNRVRRPADAPGDNETDCTGKVLASIDKQVPARGRLF